MQHNQISMHILAANLPRNHKKYTKHELITSLQEKAKELGRTPMCKDIEDDAQMPSVYPYYTMFGSLTDALKQAGLMPNRVGVHKKYSDLELLDILRSKAKSSGRTPTSEDVEADQFMPSRNTYRLRFGSFQRAIRKAGLKPASRHYVQQHSKDELLNILREKGKTLGHAPTSREIDLDPTMPASRTFRNHFGSVKNAIKEAGLVQPEFKTGIRYTKEEMLSMLKEKAKKLGRLPTQDEINSDPDMPNSLTYMYRFGSFRSACKEAGLSYRKHGRSIKYTDAELLYMLRNKTKELGRVPTGDDLGKRNSMPVRQVYVYRFGGLRKALKKAKIL